MKIGFIGAGNVGTAFGKFLVNNGQNVIGFYSRTYSSSVNAAKYTNTNAFSKLNELIAKVDLIFITTPDDTIKKTVDYITEKRWLNKEQIICHMSGALSSSTLISAQYIGCCIYSIHPLQSFADIEISVKNIGNTFFSLEGSKEKLELIKDFLSNLKLNYFVIDPNHKTIYHVAACVFSNYLVTLLDYGLILLNEIGIDKDKGIKAMLPLIKGTINNTVSFDTKDALTGPIARGEIITLKNHLNELINKFPEYFDFYHNLLIQTLPLAQKEKLPPHKAEALKELLGGINFEKSDC
ncbi:Predicted oxidoreductase, contains short-chain dehydrogenase (SDR) and DUF2520 domains [Desulfonispora thiosulfatigenes DSM 11270]|uniref:Predicted oxidoreductase, contains short-chain dehydrogenase (SDR) and DUF2520 domains n=1 Tax=Desulfonispora thiosulfatigenes DSM 11270 TaxID=656914 RepID=A0A1W1VG65_DESTI|nr:Rossmann-like and DUF2520 domain-containing protein [Desulfonispora thiosulfatigenes]SMB92358.1 Predicted oxidoreductase, contains short-chain dehydrogenase (SDR) and DUF2520 domains [Desulfonispora thiosulfatigenes DSM 11270]